MRLAFKISSVTAALIVLLALVPSVVFISKGAAETAHAKSCEEQPGASLRVSARVRLFAPPERLGTVLMCLKPHGAPRRIGRRQSLVADRPTALSGLWIAATEERGKGQDELIRDVFAQNAATGELKSCRIGSADRPGQLLRIEAIVVTQTGVIGWATREKLGYKQPVIGICAHGTAEVIARGSGIEPSSLQLRGSVLSWSNGGTREYRTLDR